MLRASWVTQTFMNVRWTLEFENSYTECDPFPLNSIPTRYIIHEALKRGGNYLQAVLFHFLKVFFYFPTYSDNELLLTL